MRVTLCGSAGGWMEAIETACRALEHVAVVRGCTYWIRQEQRGMIATVEAILDNSDLVVLFGSMLEQDIDEWISALWYFVDRASSTPEKLLVVTEHSTLLEEARVAVENTRLTLIESGDATALGSLVVTTLRSKAAD